MDGPTDRRRKGRATDCLQERCSETKEKKIKKGQNSKNISLPDGVQKFYDTFSSLHFILTTPSTACLLNRGSVL